MNRILAIVALSIIALSAGCTAEQSKSERFTTRPSFLSIRLSADRLIYAHAADSLYCNTLQRLVDRDAEALAAITESSQNNPEHAYLLAAYYYREHDYDRVLQYLKIAAPRLPQARCDLGLCYNLGIGTERNSQLARKRFEEASALGCTEADYYLLRPHIFEALDRYCKTDLILTDELTTIAERLHRPADSGNARACYYLGVCYYLLNVVDNSVHTQTKALKYLNLAADYGIRQAVEMVNEYNAAGKIQRLQYAFAIDDDNARAVYINGAYSYIESIYETDDRTKRRMQTAAVADLRKAAAYGIPQATKMIDEYTETGHINRMENSGTLIIDNDNYALTDEGYIILN